ncbi:MAG TPA: ABC transporter permease [Saprospiraceae bacterium]|nr:ABC transporter permease [Saprospiraceae bacterium]
MLYHNLHLAIRHLVKNRSYTAVNVGGLSVGMAVAMLIGLWVWDEMTYNKYHNNSGSIAQVYVTGNTNGVAFTSGYLPLPLGDELKNTWAGDFTFVVMSSWIGAHILAAGDNKLTLNGNFLSPEGPEMLGLKMVKGTRSALTDPATVLLSESVSKNLFGDTDPLGNIVKIDNKLDVKVGGIYEDLPANTTFRDMAFVAPWELYVSSESSAKDARSHTDWNNNSWQIFVQIAPNTDFQKVASKIENVISSHSASAAKAEKKIFLHPMNQWHLYTAWGSDGTPSTGRIQYVWLFGMIGFFVLLLACINFMNLSTAQSEKRAREVGIRKAIGSGRGQLIGQFFSETLMLSILAFVLSLLLVQLTLPWFNGVADKKLHISWGEPVFWASGFGFCLVTALLAGSYPALYLSSFKPLRVLKGTFRAGRFAAIPRKTLVVVQFTTSVALIIGTVLVYQQIQFAKNRPIGYTRQGLISVPINTPELLAHYPALRNDLQRTGAVAEVSTASSPTTDVNSNTNLDWQGKDPNFNANFGAIAVTHDYGKTVGWKFSEGRDFSRDFSTDSLGLVINETAVRYIGIRNPIGLTMKWGNTSYKVIGVIKDMIMESPFKPVKPTVFLLDYNWAKVITLKINPSVSAHEALPKIAAVFGVHNPGAPFVYAFADEAYRLKFSTEERIGKLASFFAVLAILISILGLFSLASYITEQRTKEIGIRKVVGASVFSVWYLLSKEFTGLVLMACLIAVPIAYYYLYGWLQQYEYRTEISPWVFVATGLGTLMVALLTVSYQAIRAALANPVRSLRSE